MSSIALVCQTNYFLLCSQESSELTLSRSLASICLQLSHLLSAHHINHLISQCNQRLFRLSHLKYQNLSAESFRCHFQALVLSKITYALPAFAGHISVADKSKINTFFRNSHRRGLVTEVFEIQSLIMINAIHFSSAHAVRYPDHCLHYLLPAKHNYSMQLRPGDMHDYTLCYIHTTYLKNVFVNRCLFSTV